MYAGIVSEERNAIIDYNEKFFLWLNLVSDISLGHTNKNNNAELDEFEKHIHDVYYNVLNSETKFKLFVNNDDLINLGNEMQIKALELLVPNLISYIYDLKINNCETENAQLMKEYDSIAKLREQTDKLHDDFTKTLIKNYKIVLPISVKFQESCRDHIYKLISSKVPH